MNKEETPISKYLAGLERRQALLTPSPAPDTATIIRKINFEDTFFHDQSVLHYSSPSPRPPVATAGRSSSSQAMKRKRLSILGETLEDEENNDKKISELSRLLQKTQGELIEARALNTKLEHQICQIKSSNSERLLGFEKSENEMRMKMRSNNDQVVLLKEQVNKLTKKEEELLERLHKQTELHCEKVKSIEDKLSTLETENLELRNKFESGSLRQTDELRKLNASLEETEMGAEKWVMETQLLRDQLDLKESQLRKYQDELKEAQVTICKYNELKSKYEYVSSSAGVSIEEKDEKIRYFENLYAKQQGENISIKQKMDRVMEENRLLRSTMNKEMLLEEQISAYEEEVKKLKASLEEKAVLEADKEALNGELQSWKLMAFKLDPDCTNSTKFESYIRKMQNQLLEAKHENSTLKLTVNDRDRTIFKNLSDLQGLQNQLKTLSIEKDNLSQELKKTTKRLTLVTKDRDGLKELKESYEQEFEGQISKPLQERINQLEGTVAEYEAMIKEDPSNKKSCGDCEKRMALISEIRSELDRLKSEKAEMETQMGMSMSMSTTMATGSETADLGDTSGMKIVSFGMNPSVLSMDTRLKEAIKENEKLKEKIKELEEKSCAEYSSLGGSSEALRELEERNRSLERRFDILSEAYDFETQQLQLIVNKLCGFNFTLVREPNVQIRLASVYSHERDDNFIFQESPNGDMLLLESPILDSFRDDIDRFLIRDGSIPGFLSSVTITYVQNQSSRNASHHQLPSSQQSASASVAEDETTASVRDPREVQIQVTRQRHPTAHDTDEDEEVEEEEDDEVEEDDDHHDDEPDDDGDRGDGDDDEEDVAEDEEHYDDEDDNDDHYDDDPEEEEPESPSPPPPPRRGQIMRAPPRPPQPQNDDSDDSDVIMID